MKSLEKARKDFKKQIKARKSTLAPAASEKSADAEADEKAAAERAEKLKAVEEAHRAELSAAA